MDHYPDMSGYTKGLGSCCGNMRVQPDFQEKVVVMMH
jgi:hypothetical protein